MATTRKAFSTFTVNINDTDTHDVHHPDGTWKTAIPNNNPTSLHNSSHKSSPPPDNQYQAATQEDARVQKLRLSNSVDPEHEFMPDPHTLGNTPANQNLDSQNYQRSYQDLPFLPIINRDSIIPRNTDEWRTHLSPLSMSPLTQSRQPYTDDELPRNQNQMRRSKGQTPLMRRELLSNRTHTLYDYYCQQNHLGRSARRMDERQSQTLPSIQGYT